MIIKRNPRAKRNSIPVSGYSETAKKFFLQAQNFEVGNGCDIDLDAALMLYERAASLGHKEAREKAVELDANLVKLKIIGYVEKAKSLVDKNVEEAIGFYEKAVVLGDRESEIQVMNLKAKLNERKIEELVTAADKMLNNDKLKALEFFREAAALGDERSLKMANDLAEVIKDEKIREYITQAERLVETDKEKSIDYYVQAASLGSVIAGEKANKLREEILVARRNQEALKFANVGDIVKFGRYYQKRNLAKYDIEWKVLKRKDNLILVISKQGLDVLPFDSNRFSSWQSCSLRKWLNDTFYNIAFSEEERRRINETERGTKKRGYWYDKVFVLEASETWSERTIEYMFNGNYPYPSLFPEKEDLLCSPTDYAKSKGAFECAGNCAWWISNTTDDNDRTMVRAIEYNGNDTLKDCRATCCVRPAMWIRV